MRSYPFSQKKDKKKDKGLPNVLLIYLSSKTVQQPMFVVQFSTTPWLFLDYLHVFRIKPWPFFRLNRHLNNYSYEYTCTSVVQPS